MKLQKVFNEESVKINSCVCCTFSSRILTTNFFCGVMLAECMSDSLLSTQLEELLLLLINLMQCIEDENDERVRAAGWQTGCPSLVVEKDHLHFYVKNGFKVKDMALMLGCSKHTVERRLHVYNLSTQRYSDISEYDLDEVVLQICVAYPCGEKLMNSHLCTCGIHVQRCRIGSL